ncbi:NUDIX hydrolase [Flexithrix dorotheae]|uniref:NUDIX hydrolase n=1 Tax=Flexithrix dorotheae TaxID=70993 RepID=UPI00036D1FC6|nr:NUDIX hydrolase [Flexithrix dorotheae]
MHRKKLLDQLQSYTTTDSHEQAMLESTISFVQENEDCFLRSNLKGQVTGSAWIIDPSKTFALFIHHKKLEKWLQPGGHSDGDGDILNVALKEAEEETGLQNFVKVNREIFDIDVHEIPERKGVPAHFHYDVRFAFMADKSQQLVISDESIDLKWIALDEIPDFNNEESILRLVRKTKGL